MSQSSKRAGIAYHKAVTAEEKVRILTSQYDYSKKMDRL